MSIKLVNKIGLVSISLLMLSACGICPNKNKLPFSKHAVTNEAVVSGTGDINESWTAQEQTSQVANQSYYFAFNKSEVQSEAKSSLQVQADYLLAHPDTKVLLIGNADERGSREYNIALGQRRALSVATILEAHGVKKEQMTTISHGAEKPLALGHTEEDYAQNRRVDLICQE